MSNQADQNLAADPNRICREPERLLLTGIPRSTWDRLERRGDAPCRIRIAGGHNKGWFYGELIAFNLAQRDRD